MDFLNIFIDFMGSGFLNYCFIPVASCLVVVMIFKIIRGILNV